MSRFVLIRHAATEFPKGKIAGRTERAPLSRLGHEQASQLSRRLKEKKLRAVYSSPQERARDTAAPLAEAINNQVQIAPELDELDYGDWTGRTMDELEPTQWQAFNAVRSCTRIPGGELMLEAQARVVGFLERLGKQHPGRPTALVTHGDVIRAALAHHLGLSLDHVLRIEISFASVSIVEIEKHQPSIVCINHTEICDDDSISWSA
jgi:probable phosphoglycerate mutase